MQLIKQGNFLLIVIIISFGLDHFLRVGKS